MAGHTSLLLILLVSLCAFKAAETSKVSSKPMKVYRRDTSEQYSECEEGWVQHDMSCYFYNQTALDHFQATNTCTSIGAYLVVPGTRTEKRFVSNFAGTSSGVWVGARYTANHGYALVDPVWIWTSGPNEGDQVPSSIYDGPSWFGNKEFCGSVTGGGEWVSKKCDNRQPFLCEKQAPCGEGWYGDYCLTPCHCRHGKCDQKTGLCFHGCKLGWTGPSCNRENPLPVAIYHCLKTREGTLLVNVTLDEKNRNYALVQAVGEDGGQLSCPLDAKKVKNKWHVPLSIKNIDGDFSYDNDNSSTVANNATVESWNETVSDNTTTSGQANGTSVQKGLECTASRVEDNENNTITWLLEFKQFDDISTGDDVTIEVTCDLDDVDTLDPSDTVADESKPDERVSAQESRVVSEVYLTNAESGDRVDEYHTGYKVVLHMNVSGLIRTERPVPHSCVLRSEADEQKNIKLIDEDGCPVQGSPVTQWKTSQYYGDFLRTAHFQTNAFPAISLDASHLKVECQLDVVLYTAADNQQDIDSFRDGARYVWEPCHYNHLKERNYFSQ